MAAPHRDSQGALFGRLFWMMFGPAILLVSAAIIINSPGTGWHTGADLTYLTALGGMVLGRWLEHRAGQARNAMGEPSSAAELRRYAIVVCAFGIAVWVGANLVSNYVLA